MGQLQTLAMQYHIALVFVHHLRKESGNDMTDEFSGSVGLTGTADTLIRLMRPRNQVEATFELSGRDIEEQELALTFDKERCTWTCTGNTAERQQSQSKQAILDALERNGEMTPKEVARELEKPRATITTTLSRMEQEGVVVKKGYGRYSLPEAKVSQATLLDQTGDQEAQ